MALMLDDEGEQPKAKTMTGSVSKVRGTVLATISEGDHTGSLKKWKYFINNNESKLILFSTNKQYEIGLNQCELTPIEECKKYELLDKKTNICFCFEPYVKKDDDAVNCNKFRIYFQNLIKGIEDILKGIYQYCSSICSVTSSINKKQKQMHQFVDMVEKSENADRLLAQYFTRSDIRNLNNTSKQTLKEALRLRNRFWNLLRETADLLKMEEDDAFHIAANFEEWPDLATVDEKDIDEDDYATMNEGFKLMKKLMSDPERERKRETLRQNWRQWQETLTDLKPRLSDIRVNNWKSNLFIGFGVMAIAGSVALAVFTAGAALPITIWGCKIGGGILCAEAFTLLGLGTAASISGYHFNVAYEEYMTDSAVILQHSLESVENDAGQFTLFLEKMIRHSRSAKGHITYIEDENGDLKVRKTFIKKLIDEFYKFSTNCEKACDAIVKVQERIVDIH